MLIKLKSKMKILKLLTAAIIALTLLNKNSFALEAEDKNKYVIEPYHTSVLWVANHFGFSDVSGKFTEIEGNIIFDEKNPSKSAVDVVIKISGLKTGIEKFDAHLKSADFFDEKRFLTAKFVSKKVTVSGKNKAKIEGELTLLGVTKTVVLDARFNKSGVSVLNQKPTIGFSATASIKRSDFGMNYALPGVSDKVSLVIQVEANN